MNLHEHAMPMPPSPLAKTEEIYVLLVEDAAGDAAAISKALHFGESPYNFHIHRCSSLSEGLHYLEQKHRVDVVLLDLGLPDAVALGALIHVHTRHPGLPIVIISGYYDMERIHTALHQGAQEFLIKGECSGATIRQSICQAIVRKKITRSYERGDKL